MSKNIDEEFDQFPEDSEFDTFKSADESSNKTNQEVSKLESAKTGAFDAASVGTLDELSGGLEVLGRTFGLEGFGSPNLTDIAPKKPYWLNEDTAGEIYDKAVDTRRGQLKKAQADNPYSYAAGGLVGGILSPANPIIPAGTATSVLGKIGQGALTGAAAGAMYGAGSGEGGLGARIESAKEMGETGALVGGGLAGTGQLLKAGYNVIPKKTKDAFSLGLDRINPFSSEGKVKINEDVKSVTGPIADDILAQRTAKEAEISGISDEIGQSKVKLKDILAEDAAEQAKQFDEAKLLADKQFEADKLRHEDAISSADKALKDAQSKIKQQLDLEKQSQLAKNDKELRELVSKHKDVGLKLQGTVDKAKNNIKKEYSNIDDSTEKLNIKFDNSDVIDSFIQDVTEQAHLDDPKLQSVIRGVLRFKGADDPGGFRLFKAHLNNLFNHDNYQVASLAKRAYGKALEKQVNTLESAGHPEIASSLKELNTRYSALNRIENDFVPSVSFESRLTPDTVDTKTISTIKNFENPYSEVSNVKSSDFSKLLNIIDPEAAPKTLEEVQTLANARRMAEEFKPQVPGVSDALAQNPEAQKLNALLEQLRTNKPLKPVVEKPAGPTPAALQKSAETEQQIQELLAKLDAQKAKVSPIDAIAASDANVENSLLSLFPKISNEGDLAAQNKIKTVLDFAAEKRGKEFVNQAKPKLERFSKAQPFMSGDSGFISQGRDVSANFIGRLTGETKKFAGDTVAYSINKARSMNPERFEAALRAWNNSNTKRISEEVIQKLRGPGRSRDAIIFSLMQRPELREHINSMPDEDSVK